MTSPSPVAAMDLSLLWTQGDWVTRSVALLLLAMSIATWSVIALKSWDLWRARRQAAGAEQFWHSASLPEGMRHLGASDSPFHQLATQGQEALAHHRQNANELHGSLSASDWISMCLRNSMDGSQARLQSGLSILASIGSTAPFVGLFGTVWGIYHALMGISASGAATIDKVAGPIGEALIMTALGLAVAIPAVLAYNALLRGNRRVLLQLQRFAHDLHAYLITGARVASKG
ncbi:MotA/TolQ/ExbB proton channel family protein [Brachymonas denitrificans]|uniref:MotA/TolQ/ExbB proton channel family protein n=1 Tax=Brachymonas denitrificans TaxID=28220 RepID=UPI00202026F9|nr:MotA/TolQ/ExbB proton channel family protein [Brachymonas denitrificans]